MKNAQLSSKRRMVMRVLTTAVSAAAMLDQFAQRGLAVTITASWAGGSVGGYAQPNAWSPAGAPADAGNTFYDVIINRPGGATVEGNLSAEILNLTIGANNSLNFDPGIQFQIAGQPGGGFGTISNDGLISLGSSSLSAQMRITFKGGSGAITGAGAILMGGPFCTIQSNSNTVLTTSNFIHGSGNLGSNTLAIINNGSIVADSSAGSLIVGLSNPGLTNNGSLSATGGGILALSGSTVTNSGTGTILADTGSSVQLLSTTLSGGTLVSNGNGTFSTLGPCALQGLTNNATMSFADNATLTLSGTIVNNGIIAATGPGASTITINASTVTLSGTGTLQLGTTGTGTTTIVGSGPLVNSSNITGHGSIAFSVVRNSGLIASNAGTGSLAISGSLPSPAILNTGTIQAASGLMNLGFGSWDNSAGTLDVLAGQTMSFGTGSSIVSLQMNGGTLNIGSGGLVQQVANSGATTLTGVTINNNHGIVLIPTNGIVAIASSTLNGNGSIAVRNGTLLLSGAIQNNSNIFVGDTTQVATMSIQSSSVSLSGTGNVFLFGNNQAIITGNGGTLANNILIEGQGAVGNGSIAIINNGIIDASGNATLTINPSSGNLTNTNRLEASQASTVLAIQNFSGSNSYTNSGTIQAFGTGMVLLGNNVSINGGTYLTLGNSTITTDASSAVAISDAIIRSGFFNVVGSSSLSVSGTITNNGSLNITAGASPAKLLIGAGSVNMFGTGTTTLSTTGAGAALVDGSGGTLNIGSSQTFHGAGTIGSTSLALSNVGTIAADINAQTLTVSPTGGNFPNTGSLIARNGATLAIVNNFAIGTFTNTGTILAQSGSSVTFSGSGHVDSLGGSIIVQPGGTAVNTATMKVDSIQDDGQFTNLFCITGPNIADAVVTGAGSFTNGDATHTIAQLAVSILHVGTVTVNQGTVTIAANGGTLGTGTVSSLSIGAGGHLDVSNHDFIIDYTLGGGPGSPINTVASLIATGFAGGSWNGVGIDSFIASAIDQNPGITHKVGLGYADASNIGSPATFGGQSIDNTATLIRYTYVGDANLDLRVNMLDFNALAANFGSGGGGGVSKRWFQGDFNYDGTVNTLDFNALANNFNFVLFVSAPPLGTVVPEPAFCGCALAMLLSRRRRYR